MKKCDYEENCKNGNFCVQNIWGSCPHTYQSALPSGVPHNVDGHLQRAVVFLFLADYAPTFTGCS